MFKGGEEHDKFSFSLAKAMANTPDVSTTGARIRLFDESDDNGPYRATARPTVARRSLQSWTVQIGGGSALIFATVLWFGGLTHRLPGATNDPAVALREQLKPQPPSPPAPPNPSNPHPSPSHPPPPVSSLLPPPPQSLAKPRKLFRAKSHSPPSPPPSQTTQGMKRFVELLTNHPITPHAGRRRLRV